MRLVEPSIEMEDAYKCMAKDYLQYGEDRYKNALSSDFNFTDYINKLKREASASRNSEYAPSTTFWLVDECNSILAVSRLRHYLVPRIEREGGHIGYDVPPSLRRKGYATLLLKLTLEKAKEMGLNRVLITCDSDNIGSAKVILNNGGAFESEVVSEQSGKVISRYWIEL